MKKIIQKFLHDKLKWGYHKNIAEFDGFQNYSECKYCNGRLCLDSQGNWFHLRDY